MRNKLNSIKYSTIRLSMSSTNYTILLASNPNHPIEKILNSEPIVCWGYTNIIRQKILVLIKSWGPRALLGKKLKHIVNLNQTCNVVTLSESYWVQGIILSKSIIFQLGHTMIWKNTAVAILPCVYHCSDQSKKRSRSIKWCSRINSRRRQNLIIFSWRNETLSWRSVGRFVVFMSSIFGDSMRGCSEVEDLINLSLN